MVKVLRCRDLGFSDDTVICGQNEQELLTKAAEHSRTAHGKSEFSDQDMQQIRSKIQDENECPEMK